MPDRHRTDLSTSTLNEVRGLPRPIPRQADRNTAADRSYRSGALVRAPQVTTFHDGARWTYGVEGEPDLGHRFEDLAPALAGARYLARSRRAVLVIQDRTGDRLETVDYGGTCDCHARDVARHG
ncbi:MAG: hypothetical protein ACJ72D_17710 [Marmoricola sp.]